MNPINLNIICNIYHKTKLKWQQEVMHKKASKKAEMDAIAIRRPLRMTAVGTMQPLTEADKKFIDKALKNDYEVHISNGTQR